MKFSISGTHWVFIAISILSLVLGVINYFNQKALLSSYEPATATVTDWVPDPKQDASGFCPVYEYGTEQGQFRSFVGNECVSKPDPATIGRQQKQIYYDPKNPYTSVETKGWFGSEGSGLILGLAGFIFFQLLGLITAFAERRRMNS